MATENEWAERIKDGQARLRKMQAMLADGTSEADAMRECGFGGERAIEKRIEAVRGAYFAGKRAK